MKPQLARKWYDDLVSGKFVQATNQLRKNSEGNERRDRKHRNGHCCLGVLSERVCRLKAVKDTGWKYDRGAGRWSDGRDSNILELPYKVADLIGLDDQPGFFIMNDTEGKSFKQIAAIVRNKYLKGTKYDPKK